MYGDKAGSGTEQVIQSPTLDRADNSGLSWSLDRRQRPSSPDPVLNTRYNPWELMTESGDIRIYAAWFEDIRAASRSIMKAKR